MVILIFHLKLKMDLMVQFIPLRFNLTHSDGIVACAISVRIELGIDAENMNRARSPMDIARSVFAPSELAALERAPQTAREELFFAFWTLKEAYVKARGLGLSLPLDRFAFTIGESDLPTIAFHRDLDDDPADWQFQLYRIDHERMLSVAAHNHGVPSRITLRSAAQLITGCATRTT